MQAIGDIFKKIWPSVRAFAQDLGEKPDTVSRWRLHGRIPQGHWPIVIEKSAERGYPITADQLLTLSTPMKQRGRPAHKRKRRSRK